MSGMDIFASIMAGLGFIGFLSLLFSKDDNVQYRMVDKGGKEIFRSNSFLGFILTIIGTIFLVFIAIMIIGLVVSGIAKLFS